jgi:hypothetical protein
MEFGVGEKALLDQLCLQVRRCLHYCGQELVWRSMLADGLSAG